MFRKPLLALGALLMILAVSVSVSTPREAEAGVTDTLTALAGPLAEQFGLPGSAVQALFDKGISLESATQLLLISQSSKTALADVSKLYDDSNKNVTQTAEKLKVETSAYSADKVQAAIDSAKADAAASQKKAAEDASKAAGSAVGGFMKK